MKKSDFSLISSGGYIVLQEGNDSCLIRQTVDNDVMFSASKEKAEIEFRVDSDNFEELQAYLVFESLMKSIIGRYILNDYHKEGSLALPEDFINLEDRRIIWHSDSSTDNTLMLEYTGNSIRLAICKDIKANRSSGNIVRIRTNGSDYNYYYQEFVDFYRNLEMIEKRLHPDDKSNNEIGKQFNNKGTSKRKRLYIFKHL